MADMQSPNVSSGARPTHISSQAELSALRHLAGALGRAQEASPAADSSMRARIMEIGDKAEQAQLAAGMARRAIETLDAIEEALSFALDSAEEAGANRSLPEAALEELQKQVDIAVNCVEGLSGAASFAGRALFSGAATVQVADKRLPLPRVAPSCLGLVNASGRAQDMRGSRFSPIDYSRSIASAGSGGPNSLACWADGAAATLAAGIVQVRGIRESVAEFYRGAILPSIQDLSVTVSNTLASESRGENIEAVVRLLNLVRRDIGSSRGADATSCAEGVIRLLDGVNP